MRSFSRRPCVIVASMGRSGSTLTFMTLNKAAKTWFNRSPGLFCQSLGSAPLSPGSIVKTHDYPDALRTRPEEVRVLFVFGSTYDAALSVYACRDRLGEAWVAEHFRNCKSPASLEDLFEFDALGMAQQVRDWSVFDRVPVMCARLDALWRYAADISRFTGYAFDPSPKRARVAHAVPDHLKQRAQAVYAPLDEEIGKLPDLFMAGPEMAASLEGIPCNQLFSKNKRP